MTATSAQQIRNYTGPSIFSFGFRPFFLGGALIAVVMPLLMAAFMAGALDFGGHYGAIALHGHEMVYGYLSAIIAGFLLTAVPNWTGRLPIVGRGLVAIFVLWIGGRFAVVFSGVIDARLVLAIDASFLFVMSAILWREILTGKNWRNAPIGVMVTLFASGNLVWHLEYAGIAQAGLGLRWGLGIVALLLALIGGRVTPSFTRNWLAKNNKPSIEAGLSIVDKISLALIGLGVLLWIIKPTSAPTGGVLIAAALANILRLYRWGGWRTTSEPLVMILHVGYFWLVVALMFLGLAALAPSFVSPLAALHALSAGAAGVMTLAVMTRATLGHTGRPLSADRSTLVIYVLVNLGAVIRVAAPFIAIDYSLTVMLSAILWSAAFFMFAIVYGRYLILPKASG
ncbi:MAG: short-chain dehydrogenase [Hyphococcus sp.]|nr:MAG: short-chain dehydrogenase [Marinicaulis sp.]